jgi:hypothetical protein
MKNRSAALGINPNYNKIIIRSRNSYMPTSFNHIWQDGRNRAQNKSARIKREKEAGVTMRLIWQK